MAFSKHLSCSSNKLINAIHLISTWKWIEITATTSIQFIHAPILFKIQTTKYGWCIALTCTLTLNKMLSSVPVPETTYHTLTTAWPKNVRNLIIRSENAYKIWQIWIWNQLDNKITTQISNWNWKRVMNYSMKCIGCTFCLRKCAICSHFLNLRASNL